MNSTMIYSDYFGKIFELSKDDIETIISIYLEIAEEQGFQKEIEGTDDLILDTSLFDHIAYHVSEFGKDCNGFENISNLFI